MVRWSSFLLSAALLTLTACKRSTESGARGSSAANSSATQQVFEVKGLIISVKPAEKSIEIKHEAIPGYMPAMTMPIDVKDTNLLAGVQAGDSILFRLRVTDTEGWIDQIQKLGSGPTNTLPTSGSFRLVREVEPLKVGDLLPDYRLTNQLGQPIATASFKGQALAFTFLFTRCPFPTFCPLMANHFAEVQQKLEASSNAPTNWQLLTISFDPDYDTPAVLKEYAEHYKYDPGHWTFATGALIDITALGEQVGLNFWHDQTGSISHNLRTVVIDASGRLRKVFQGNQWRTDELVEEILQAAKAPP